MQAYEGRLASWTVWVANKNMKVPDVAKRYNMSEEEFRQINKIPPRMLIKAGSALLVPRMLHHQNDVSAKLADSGQLNLAPDVTMRKHIIKARKNDSLVLIAKRYKVTADQVAQWNGLSVNSPLRPGQKISLMLPAKAKARAKTKKVKAPAAASRKKTPP